ncbi:Uncharacterised protein [Vibrio cholerae]|nr:Uncharacterised protein [Vibrio cholerae]
MLLKRRDLFTVSDFSDHCDHHGGAKRRIFRFTDHRFITAVGNLRLL